MKKYRTANEAHVGGVRALIAGLGTTLTLIMAAQADTFTDAGPGGGNVIFIHPDGTGLNHWNAARMYWKGPDGILAWDGLPEMAVYRGHMADQLTATSNGGATVHAFGFKVQGSDSYGKDSGRPIFALSGFPGSIMRQAASKGHPVGVINDGDAAEPGTGAFLAEVDSRDEANEVARQILEGRPGFSDPDPVIVLGGGERFFLPEGTPRCETEVTPKCAVHFDPLDRKGPAREDGRNLIQEAIADQWIVIRTRDEFAALSNKLQSDARYAPKVLGLFAADDIFNDEPEEVLFKAGMVDESRAASDRRKRLIIWGDKAGRPGFNPPTAAEMTALALTVLERRSRQVERPFLLVTEIESPDNLGNTNNAIGTLRAINRADEVIDVARKFQEQSPRTLILTVADSDAGGLQVESPPPVDDAGNVTANDVNPTGADEANVRSPRDGVAGRRTQPLLSAPDARGQALPFAVAWIGKSDVAGAILSRAQGLNAHYLRQSFFGHFDNTDVYRLMYLTLFGVPLPPAKGQLAPDRP
ncbi:MAG: alkaline phosphatase [Gammaproteobacteria bacterium]|jgi:alkaline phosphatase